MDSDGKGKYMQIVNTACKLSLSVYLAGMGTEERHINWATPHTGLTLISFFSLRNVYIFI